MSNESNHEHSGGETPHRHSETDELATQRERRERGDQTVELREEELQARTDTVETGRVNIGKEIVEETQTIDVPVTREEVTIERRPVERRPADGGIGEGEATLRVPVREEQVSVDKRTVVTEEVSVGRRQVPDTQQVSGTVRREEVRVEREGDVADPDR
jgi:uncharacterized protein (TIGR02271 family)